MPAMAPRFSTEERCIKQSEHSALIAQSASLSYDILGCHFLLFELFVPRCKCTLDDKCMDILLLIVRGYTVLGLLYPQFVPEIVPP